MLPPDLKDWVPGDELAHDELAHFIIAARIIAAIKGVPLGTFKVNVRNSGAAQHHPQMMFALLVHSYANGTFSVSGGS